MSSDSGEFAKRRPPQRRRFTVPLVVHVFSLALVLLSWALFNWLSVDIVAGELFPLLLLLTGISWLLDWLLKLQGLARPWNLKIGWRGLGGYATLVIVVSVAGPTYAYLYGVWTARHVVAELQVAVRLEGQEVVLVEQDTHLAKPYSFRGVASTYTLLEPAEEVKAQLRDRLKEEQFWKFSRGDYFWATCNRGGYSGFVTLFLTDDSTLQVAIHYAADERCLLP